MNRPPKVQELTRKLGPGLITGAADDDPSGIATYSQAGAQFRFSLAWTLLITTPLMIGIQLLSARIGWVTGEGLGRNIARSCPPWQARGLVGLLVLANTLNIAADVSAMGAAGHLLAGGPVWLHCLGAGLLSLTLQLGFTYERTVRLLKWLTLVLFAYVAVVLSVSVPGAELLDATLRPWRHLPAGTTLHDYAAMVVAVLGTTISPYLFFWQAAQEVEDNARRPEAAALRQHPAYTAEHLARIRLDTYVGMVFSNLIAICIVVATAVTLNRQGITHIDTAAQAAQALRPVAGELAFALFALGILGTGLLAVPVLAGSAAYAVSEVAGWRAGLSRGFREARGFYLLIIAATVVGSVMGALALDPIQALVWSAIVNGVISVPIMAVMLRIGQSSERMGALTIGLRHRLLGWTATGLMAVSVVVLCATSL